MIWLIGNCGMLGAEIDKMFRKNRLSFVGSDREVDISDEAALFSFIQKKDLKKVDWIVNCAAYTAVDKAEDEPELAFRINSKGVLNLAKIAKHLDATLIHISTDYVFDGEKKAAYAEEDPPNPIGVYGKSKLEGEAHIKNILTKYYIIRTAWLYGKNGGNFVNTMLRLFKEKDSIGVVSDQWGSPTNTHDLASAIIEIIKTPHTDTKNQYYGIYHYANEGKTNWHEFACEIYKIAKINNLIKKNLKIIPILTCEYKTRAKRPQNSYLSKDKIKKNFGISIRSWQDALSDFILRVM